MVIIETNIINNNDNYKTEKENSKYCFGAIKGLNRELCREHKMKQKARSLSEIYKCTYLCINLHVPLICTVAENDDSVSNDNKASLRVHTEFILH